MAQEIDNLDLLKQSPYLSRFDESQNRSLVLHNPDRPLQASELLEAQLMQRRAIQGLGDSLLADGDIQSGMSPNKTDNVVQVDDGKVYLSGQVRNFKQQSITITGKGTEILGVKLKQTIITPDDDTTLVGQVVGTNSYLSKGADRLEEEVVLTLNDTNSAPIIRYEDGELFINTENPQMTQINKVLAERTYDESGSYRVSGFDLYTEKHRTDPDNYIQQVVDAGRAYILGYKVDKPVSSRINLEKSKTTRTVNNEGFYYDTSNRKSTLGNAPVARVTRVTGQVRVTKETVSRGVTTGGSDFLKNTSIIAVERVWTEGDSAKGFKQGSDYQVTGGQSISWSPSGKEPSAGSTYFVTYIYNKAMVLNTDYKITISGEGDNKTWAIDFNGLSGSKPVDETLVNVDYEYYLARRDLIVLDSNGVITIKKGQPDSLRLVEAPNHLDPLTLLLGYTTVYPNSDTAVSVQSTITRLSMEDLQKLRYRVDNLEYNQAVNALDQPAMAGENPVYLRGVFSDGFISLDKYDSSHPDANVAFSFEDASITLPYDSINKVIPKVATGATTAHVWGRLVTAPFTEEKSISQPLATEVMNVNPYNVFNRQGILTVDPSADNWIEEKNITITQQETSTMTVKRWWAHKGESWVSQEQYKTKDIQLDKGQGWGGKTHAFDRKHGRTGTIMSSGGQETIENMIEFIRQRDVNISASNLLPNANNLRLTFDGVTVPVTPAEGYQKGSNTGTVRSDANGTFKGKFTIPAGIRTGVREVTLQNNDNLASTTYTAQGTLKTTKDIIIRTRVTINLYDPLAQSFQFTENKVVSSFGLYFASKDANTNVIVQVRGISEGGQPNKTVYAERVLTPADVKISEDGSVATKVTFDDPLMVEAGKEYCVVIITDSNKYTMWVATMGQPRFDKPSETVNSNPYLQGVLYSSSNASAWTPHQSSDLKFDVYTAIFNKTAVLEFDTMTKVNADGVILMATYLTPQNTGCTWEMKMVLESEATSVTIADKPWRPIANYVDMDVNQVAREVKLKATFDSNRYMSPLLSLDDIMFAGFLTKLRASYVARNIDMAEAPFNNVKMTFNQYTPGSSKVTPRFSTDGGTKWQTFTKPPTTKSAGEEYTTVVYEQEVAIGIDTKDQLKVRLDLESPSSFIRPRCAKLMVLAKNL